MPIYWKSLQGFRRQETVVCKNRTIHFCCSRHTVCERFYVFCFFLSSHNQKICIVQSTCFGSIEQILVLLFFLLLWINCRIVPIQCSWVVCVWTLLAEKFLMQQGWIYKSIIYSVIHTVDLFCRALFGNIHSSSLSGRVGAFEVLKRWIHNSFFFLWSSEVTWIADVFLIAPCLARLCPGRGVCDCPQVCALLMSCRWEQHLRIGCWTVLAVKGQAPIQHHFCPLLKFHIWRISWSVSSDRLKPFPVIFCSFKSTEY